MHKILIVEDEPAYQQILKDTFEKAQFKVVLASDSKQVIFETLKNHPDLILLDIMLPGGINGFDLLEKLKINKQTKNIPVIILTNITSEEVVAKKIGAVSYFIKSEITIEQIIDKVKQLLG